MGRVEREREEGVSYSSDIGKGGYGSVFLLVQWSVLWFTTDFIVHKKNSIKKHSKRKILYKFLKQPAATKSVPIGNPKEKNFQTKKSQQAVFNQKKSFLKSI